MNLWSDVYYKKLITLQESSILTEGKCMKKSPDVNNIDLVNRFLYICQ